MHITIRYSLCAILVIAACSRPMRSELSLEKMTGFPTEDPGFLKGVSALYAGVVDRKLILAGGCNFPDQPAAEGGTKVFYNGVYAATLTDDSVFQWNQVGSLPHSAAYGVSISTEKGLICVGGSTSTHSLSDVMLLSLPNDTLAIDTLPSLPVTMDNMAGALWNNTVYVLGGNQAGLPSSDMFSLNLLEPEKGWQKETPVPGNPRVQPVCVAQGGKLYVWAGFTPSGDGREASVAVDGYAYTPETKEWSTVAAPVDGEGNLLTLTGGAGVAWDDNTILGVGGVNKTIFLQAIQGIYAGKTYLSHPAAWYQFNKNILVYHPEKDQWACLGEYAQGARAGAAFVRDGSDGYIINGELKPGIRTNEITRIKRNK